MKRIIDLPLIDAATHTYRLPMGMEIVFDGDVALEASGYLIDPIDARIKLKRPPAGTVRALVNIPNATTGRSAEAVVLDNRPIPPAEEVVFAGDWTLTKP